MMAFGDSMNDYEIPAHGGNGRRHGQRSVSHQSRSPRKVIGTNVDRSVQRELHALLEGAR